MPAAKVLHTKATTCAISSTVSKRLSSDVGRTFSKNSFSNSAKGFPRLSLSTNSSTPSERVGPGSTELTGTAVPLVSSARPTPLVEAEMSASELMDRRSTRWRSSLLGISDGAASRSEKRRRATPP